MGLSSKSKTALSKAALFAASIIWGSSFIVVKGTVDSIAPAYLVALRFTLGFIMLSLLFITHYKNLNFDYIKRGGMAGICLFIAYFLQTVGITDTTAGKNAFLTAVYCVFVPFMTWLFFKMRPKGYDFLAAFICIAGIGCVSITGDIVSGFTIGYGDLVTLASGLFFGIHVVLVFRFSEGRDMVLFTIVQFFFVSVCAFISAAFSGPFPTEIGTNALLGVLFLALFPTAIGTLFQNLGQKFVEPSAASLILSLESVFGALFSVVFMKERLTAATLIGFVLIFVSIVISQTRLSFLRKQNKPVDTTA